MLLTPVSGERGKAYARRSRSIHMSMSEFDRRSHGQENEDSLHVSTQHDTGLREDFSAEDLAFAQELATLFSPEAEEMPPYFVQTLLDAENPRYQPVENGLEQRTSVRVFRRL